MPTPSQPVQAPPVSAVRDPELDDQPSRVWVRVDTPDDTAAHHAARADR